MSICSVSADLLERLRPHALISFLHSSCPLLVFLCMCSSSEVIWLLQSFPRGKRWIDSYISSALWKDSRTFNSLTFFFCFRDVWLISLTTETLCCYAGFPLPAPFPVASVAQSRLGLHLECQIYDITCDSIVTNWLYEYVTVKIRNNISYLNISTHNHCQGFRNQCLNVCSNF